MPRDYDEMRNGHDSTFKIRGETFRLKRVPYTVLEQIRKMEQEYLDGEDFGYVTTAKLALGRLRLLLDDSDGALSRFEKLTTRAEDPVTYGEIMDLSTWAFEETTGLPTQPPSGSPPSPGNTDDTSKAGSGSRVVTPKK